MPKIEDPLDGVALGRAISFVQPIHSIAHRGEKRCDYWETRLRRETCAQNVDVVVVLRSHDRLRHVTPRPMVVRSANASLTSGISRGAQASIAPSAACHVR